jgi:predicted ATPase/transcriptional regulator with XRE-family HTH domain
VTQPVRSTDEGRPGALPACHVLLRSLREARGISREGWAARLGYGRATLQRWEAGETVPNAAAEAALVALCEELGLFGPLTHGPLTGMALTPELLRRVLAEARLPSAAAAPVLLHPPPLPAPLPASLTSLVGREQELAAIAGLVRAERLVTLTGPGGVGKTRLAITTAGALQLDFPDRVGFVALAAVMDPQALLFAIARTLDVAEAPGTTLLESLCAALRGRALLVLDNFEQLAPAAPLLAELLAGAPSLHLLVTSRAVLRISGEQEYLVGPLGLPPAGEWDAGGQAPHDLVDYPAVRLFIERARHVDPGFQLTGENAAVVGAICRRLDGLPLAIELAAARTRLLTPRALLARLGNGLQLLSGGPRDAPARQQTLRQTIAWSYDLLSPVEQTLFRRLAVFAGGCRIEAAEAVCAGEQRATSSEQRGGEDCDALLVPDVLDGLAALLDQSLLVRQEDPDGEPRFGMLEMIREFAAERLVAGGEEATLCRRHAAWCATLVQTTGERLGGPGERGRLQQIDRELDNLRTAMTWSLGETGDGGEVALEIAGGLSRFWDLRGRFAEGRRWLEAGLARHGGDDRRRERALAIAGQLAARQGEIGRARTHFEAALPLARALGDRHGEASLLTGLANMATREGAYEPARARYREALALQQALGATDAAATTAGSLGFMERQAGDLAASRAWLEEAVRSLRRRDATSQLALALVNLAQTALPAGDMAATRAALRESLELCRDLRITPYRIGGLRTAMLLTHTLGDDTAAARLAGATDAQMAAHGRAIDGLTDQALYQQAKDEARATLGPEAFASTYAEGRHLSLDAAAELALDVTVREDFTS